MKSQETALSTQEGSIFNSRKREDLFRGGEMRELEQQLISPTEWSRASLLEDAVHVRITTG